MEAMRESWTDERLDYLNQKVEDGFARMDERFDEVSRRLDLADKRFEQMDKRFEQMNDRMLELHRLMIQGGIAVFGTVFVAFATFLATST